MLNATFWRTPCLSIKGRVGSGNGTLIMMTSTEMYCALLYCTVPLCGNKACDYILVTWTSTENFLKLIQKH